MSLELDFGDLLRGIDTTVAKTQVAIRNGVQDSVDDLKRIAVDIAPIEDGDLRRSANAKVTGLGDNTTGEVTFSVTTDSPKYGRFNYAYWTHEIMASGQAKASGGTDGYSIGNKYLERPLKGEAEKYKRWIAEEIKDAVGD